MRIPAAAVPAVLILLATAMPASAQEQTVEGAQQFLGLIAGQGATRFEADFGSGWNEVSASKIYCRYYSRYTTTGLLDDGYNCSDSEFSSHRVTPYQLAGMTSLGRCATQVQPQPRNDSNFEVDHGRKNYWKVRANMLQGPVRIDWDKVAEVKQSGSSITVTGISPAMRFHLASEALAARVTFAMEFLRMNCDTTAGTGF